MLDATDRAIINALQDGFPLVPRPYAAAADPLGISEVELMSRIEVMLAGGELTRFGPMFNADRMGGTFCLCAMVVPRHDFERVAAIVNSLPQVAHNYERAHALNMWFVLATESADEIAPLLADLKKRTGHDVFDFPKLEEFFIGFRVTA